MWFLLVPKALKLLTVQVQVLNIGDSIEDIGKLQLKVALQKLEELRTY